MKLQSLARRDVVTGLGALPLWSRPEVFAGAGPVVLGIQGNLAGPDDLAGLPGALAGVADAAIVGGPPAGLAGPGPDVLAAYAGALDELVAATFPGRPVVVLGVSLGALAALAMKGPSVRRIVAVEPPLVTGGLWPLEQALQAQLRAHPAAPGLREALWRFYGVGPETSEPRDYRALLEGLSVPADVVLAGEPLAPRRPVERLPSLVGEAERARLAVHPRVRLHLARGAGHNVQGQAGPFLKEVLLEACRRAGAEPVYDPRQLDEPLVEATPLTAGRVLHWGPGGRSFAAAYLSWNPAGQVAVLGEGPDARPDAAATPFDAVVLGAPPPNALFERLVARLAPGGHLVMRGASAGAARTQLREPLARAGLVVLPAVDGAGTGVFRARKAAAGAPPPEPLHVEMVAFAPRLMDVRTRLPARGLRSDPELVVAYATAPYGPPRLPVDAPKVLVMQRQGAEPLETIRGQLAHVVARGWLVVIEYDDHPGLVAEALGRPAEGVDLARFGYAHAVQTTTEPLARFFAGYNPQVRIFENAVFELAPFPAGERPRRVFYGAVARGAFGVAVARSLAPVVAAFPEVAFEVLGDRAVFEALPTANKRFTDYLPYEAYLARMADCAVSLSPIEALPMREMKSDAKFLDAARAGVLTIASPLIYERTVVHGHNGLIARRLEDWAPLLTEALGRPDRRRAMARKAWEEVRAGRMFARQIPARRDWYRELWSRRAELDEALFARVPGLAEAVAAQRASLAAQDQLRPSPRERG
jgi:hypothetical protein